MGALSTDMCHWRTTSRRCGASGVVAGRQVVGRTVTLLCEASCTACSRREEQRRCGSGRCAAWRLSEGLLGPRVTSGCRSEVVQRHSRAATNMGIHSALLARDCRHSLHIGQVLRQSSALDRSVQRPRNEASPEKHASTEETQDRADTDEDGSVRKIRFLHEERTSGVWDLLIRHTNTSKSRQARQLNGALCNGRELAIVVSAGCCCARCCCARLRRCCRR